jgi:hypothetical protein
MGSVIFSETRDVTTSLSVLSILVVLAPSTLALLGVLWATWHSARQSERNERIRAQAGIGSELFAERRRAELAAMRLVAEAASALHDFHESMYGNSGKGADDRRSAKAIAAFGEKFGRMLALEECAHELAAYGSKDVSLKVQDIAFNIGTYFNSLGDDHPKFIAAKAVEFEAALKEHFDELVDMIRSDFGIDTVQRVVWGTSK